jgi:hypothetical protein
MNKLHIRDDELLNQIKQAMKHQDLSVYRQKVSLTCEQLHIDASEFAALLLCIVSDEDGGVLQRPKSCDPVNLTPKIRSVRYRLNVGKKHKIRESDLIALLVDVSGVDKKRIQRLEVRSHFSLVDLPEGMPGDIFQLLYDAELNGQKLEIKRVKSSRLGRKRPKSRWENPAEDS